MARWWFQPQFLQVVVRKNTLKPPPRWDKRTLPYLNKNLKRQAAWCFQLAFHPKLPPGSAFFRLWQTTRKPPNLLVVTFLGSILKISPELGEKLFGEVDLPGSPSLKLTGLRTCKIDSWKMIVSSFFPVKGCKSCLFSGVKSGQDFREAIFQQLLFTSASGSLLRTLRIPKHRAIKPTITTSWSAPTPNTTGPPKGGKKYGPKRNVIINP